MKVLIACEESQNICIEFRKLGHEAYSCDIQECSGSHPEWHIQGDVIPLLQKHWDIIIAHPPCTYLSNAGIKWFNEEKYGQKAIDRKQKREEALKFFMQFTTANSNRICIENPTGWVNSHYRKPDQIIHPYYFGDTESKRTCLWLFGLPKLKYTKIVKPKIYGYYKTGKHKGEPIYFHGMLAASKDRSKKRSKTFPGIAKAMAKQWGNEQKIKKYYIQQELKL